MKLSPGEKLILVMLADIQKHLKIQGNIDPELVLASIYNNKLWGLSWEYDSVVGHDEESDPAVKETCDILDMYRFITHSFDELSKAEQARVKKEAEPFGVFVKFRGFDGNNDDHFHIMSYLVQNLKRYTEHDKGNGAVLNSHSMGTISTYRRMLAAYRPMMEGSSKYGELSADQLIEILKAPGRRT